MKMTIKRMFLMILLMVFFISAIDSQAAIKEQKGKKEQVQRTATQNFDLQENSVSNFKFPVTNYGILFLDVAKNTGGGYWPRGSFNQYFFGGGIWFAAQKWVWTDTVNTQTGDTIRYRKQNKLVEVTYNPNSGNSWMVPGRIEDGDAIDNTDITKYRVYFSTDFRPSDGIALNPNEGPNWPIWDASKREDDRLKFDRYFGHYIPTPEERTTTFHPRGPAFISGEDIFSTFKDTDLNFYEGGVQFRKNLGYPLRLQFEQYIYSWGFGDYKDFIFLRYDIINKSQDTLMDCWLAPVMDVDIALAPNTAAGADNDKARFYDEDPSLNLCAQWTLGNRGEAGKGFGYLGFDFLESPAVYNCEKTIDTLINGVWENLCIQCLEEDFITVENWQTPEPGDYVDSIFCVEQIVFPPEKHRFGRTDRKWYPNPQQIGLKTFRRWAINDDLQEDAARYEYISAANGIIEEGEGNPGDYRFLMATGPINILPGDTVRTVVGIILANSLDMDGNGIATGKADDMAELVRKDIFAQQVYDNNFRAPEPPNRSSILKWQPLNHAVSLTWDSTAEISLDLYERGMDFMGFRLYRARRNDLDTFDLDQVSPSIRYTSGKGPLGWKQVAQYQIPTPFKKSIHRAGTNPKDMEMPFIDSLSIIGPSLERTPSGEVYLDTFAIKVMRVAKGIMPLGPDSFLRKYIKNITRNIDPNNFWDRDSTLGVFIMGIDTALVTQPWGPYLLSKTKPSDFPIWYDPYNIDNPRNRNFILDSVCVGTIRLDKALLDYNPLYWKRVSMTVDPADTADFPNGTDTITKIKYLKDTYRDIMVDGVRKLVMDQLHPVPTNLAMRDTMQVKLALDSIYHYIQNGMVKFDFPDFEGREDVRLDIIAPYMKMATRGNSFVDIGDDNYSGDITYSADPTKTEKIINNVPYYYKLLAYDEGDFMQPTPRKLNSAGEGLPNYVQTYGRAASVGHSPKFTVTYVDSARMGGLYNFKFFAYDPDRAKQLFAGHELEMEFQPNWSLSNMTISKRVGNAQVQRIVPYSLYRSLIRLTDKTDKDRLLFYSETFLEQTSGLPYIRGGFTENAQSWVVDYEVIDDTIRHILIDMPEPSSDTLITRSSVITTGDFKTPGYYYSRSFAQPAYGTIGFSFNYTAQQRGGLYRPDSSSIFPVIGNYPSPIIDNSFAVPITFLTDINSQLNDTTFGRVVKRTQETGWNITGNHYITRDDPNPMNVVMGISPEYGTREYGSYNNGPAEYLIEFKAGGTETLNLKSTTLGTNKDFVCDYLLMDVKNVISYKRPNPTGGDSIVVRYPLPIEHLKIDTGNGNKYPDLLMLGNNSNDFIGKYNLSSYGWIDGYMLSGLASFTPRYAVPGTLNNSHYLNTQRIALGQQGRFYLGGKSTDSQNEIFFVNGFLASGVNFVFDMAKNERFNGAVKQWSLSPEAKSLNIIKPKPGDKVLLKTNGGALGFPLPGAKIKVKIEADDISEKNIDDDLLDQVMVVPNPYYITHEGQSSPYDAKIYFTKLPKRATINIYTATGDLVKTMEHNEFTSPQTERISVEVWDLLTKNRQRVQSQTFVAVISTPDGAKSVKQFSVVVGGFRLVPED